MVMHHRNRSDESYRNSSRNPGTKGSLGIPKDSILKYETALKSDKFLLVAHGTADDVAKARDILQPTHPAELGVHVGAPAETRAR